nr:methylthioadenosine phosphorylase [Hymenolepis microstoma]
MSPIKVGIIGGSGLDDPNILENQEEINVDTPFGKPSDALLKGTICGVPCVLLPRHGRKHNIMPGNVNFRANLWALKQAGCTHVLASNACGGLQEHTHPGDLVVLDDFFDRTHNRKQTFYDGESNHPEGVVHIPCGEIYCQRTREVLTKAAKKYVPKIYVPGQRRVEQDGPHLHLKGSCVTIEGPRFSSRCESKIFHRDGFDVINMTNVPEVILAKEAGLSYAALAIVTDYDAWHESHEAVSVETVVANFKKSAETVKNIFIEAIKLLKEEKWDDIIAVNKTFAEKARQDVH